MTRNEYVTCLQWMQNHNIISYIQYSELLNKGLPYTKEPKRKTLRK